MNKNQKKWTLDFLNELLTTYEQDVSLNYLPENHIRFQALKDLIADLEKEEVSK